MDARERLEIEDEDEREERLGKLLVQVDQAGENNFSTIGPSATPQRVETSIPTSVEPPVELLDRVRQFLPQLAESNASLSNRDRRELDIENVSDSGSYYVEMNLGLGVFEYRRQGTHSDEGSSAFSSSSSSTDEVDDEDSDSSSSGSSSCSEDDVRVAARPKKPLPKRATPAITILSELERPPGRPSA